MDLFDSINLYLASHPGLLDHVLTVFRIKYWLLSCIAIYFMFLPLREHKKREKAVSMKNGQFLA